MRDLAMTVLSLIRTRADVSRWSTANGHAEQMLRAAEILERAIRVDDPTVIFSVTQQANASAPKVIMRTDESRTFPALSVDKRGKLIDLTLPILFRTAYEWAGFADLGIGTRLACRAAPRRVGPRLRPWQSG